MAAAVLDPKLQMQAAPADWQHRVENKDIHLTKTLHHFQFHLELSAPWTWNRCWISQWSVSSKQLNDEHGMVLNFTVKRIQRGTHDRCILSQFLRLRSFVVLASRSIFGCNLAMHCRRYNKPSQWLDISIKDSIVKARCHCHNESRNTKAQAP